MSVPSGVVGAGNDSTARNVFSVTFSEATSNVPTLEAWDNYNFNTIAHEVFTGTAGNTNKPMIAAVATTDAVPGSAWVPSSATVGGDTANLLAGDTSFCNLSAAAIAQNGSVRFNLNWQVPSDASIPSDMEAVLVVRFTYAGAAPVLTWQFNDNVGSGTEGTPVWTDLTPGVSGHTIKPADTGATSATVILHRPVTGVIDAGEIWVV